MLRQRTARPTGARGNLVAFTASQPEHPLMLDEEAAARLVSACLKYALSAHGIARALFLRPESRLPDLSIYPSGERMDAFRGCFPLPVLSVSTGRWETHCACETLMRRSEPRLGAISRSSLQAWSDPACGLISAFSTAQGGTVPAGDMDALPPWWTRESRCARSRGGTATPFRRTGRRSGSPIERFSRTLPSGGYADGYGGFFSGEARSRCLTRLVTRGFFPLPPSSTAVRGAPTNS